ncbi:MAG TPA: hypothetical protein PKW35_02215 [Nannocystaceae bacterium]|nr:hypothetical protein [Nannocystaceae bacterium]
MSLERGWLDSASMALESLRECHGRLHQGKIGEAFVSEDYVKLWGLSGESGPMMRCNSGHCHVKMVSNYFSWSRPLEDFSVKGEEGKRKGVAVVGAIISTPLMIGPLTGYRNTRSAFRGTVHYERPRDPEKHMHDLIGSLTEAAQRVEFSSKARGFHGQAARVLASVGREAQVVLRYQIQTALAYADLGELSSLIAKHAGSTEKIEAIDYVGLVAQAPPSIDRSRAMNVIEPYYFDDISSEPSETATERYLALFPTGERSAEVRAIQASLVEFRTKVAGRPRALLAFWNQHRDDLLGKMAIKPLQELVTDSVKVLDPHIYVTNGDGSWVNDAVKHLEANGVYGGERFNVFILGKIENRSSIELPVRLKCHFQMWKKTTVRALVFTTTEVEPLIRNSSFVAHLPPKKSKVFVCLLKNQNSGGGISAGMLGSIDGSVLFRDPPAYLAPAFEPKDIAISELNAQEEVLSALASSGNIATKVDPRSPKVAVVAAIPDATKPGGLLVVDRPFYSNFDPPARSSGTDSSPQSSRSAPPPQPSRAAQPPQTASPDSLTLEDIKESMRGPKESAQKRCKALARSGESVALKLSISGPDGSVQDAIPVGETRNTELTQCVTRELRAARFRRVQKSQINFQFRVAF